MNEKNSVKKKYGLRGKMVAKQLHLHVVGILPNTGWTLQTKASVIERA